MRVNIIPSADVHRLRALAARLESEAPVTEVDRRKMLVSVLGIVSRIENVEALVYRKVERYGEEAKDERG
jgi:hypothetical protein